MIAMGVAIAVLLILYTLAGMSNLKLRRKVSNLQWKYGNKVDSVLLLEEELREAERLRSEAREGYENGLEVANNALKRNSARAKILEKQVDSRTKRIGELEQKLSEEVDAHNVSKKVIKDMKQADADVLVVMNEIATRLQEAVYEFRSRF